MLTAKFTKHEKYVIRKACDYQIKSLIRIVSGAESVRERDGHTKMEWADQITDDLKKFETSKISPHGLFKGMDERDLGIFCYIIATISLDEKWEKGRAAMINKLNHAKHILLHRN